MTYKIIFIYFLIPFAPLFAKEQKDILDSFGIYENYPEESNHLSLAKTQLGIGISGGINSLKAMLQLDRILRQFSYANIRHRTLLTYSWVSEKNDKNRALAFELPLVFSLGIHKEMIPYIGAGLGYYKWRRLLYTNEEKTGASVTSLYQIGSNIFLTRNIAFCLFFQKSFYILGKGPLRYTERNTNSKDIYHSELTTYGYLFSYLF